MVGPSGHAGDGIALGETLRLRGDYPAHTLARHGAADGDRLGIAFGVIHAPAHVGIERQPLGADQDLALGEVRQGLRLEREILGLGAAFRAAGKGNAAVGIGHSCDFRIEGGFAVAEDAPPPSH